MPHNWSRTMDTSRPRSLLLPTQKGIVVSRIQLTRATERPVTLKIHKEGDEANEPLAVVVLNDDDETEVDKSFAPDQILSFSINVYGATIYVSGIYDNRP